MCRKMTYTCSNYIHIRVRDDVDVKFCTYHSWNVLQPRVHDAVINEVDYDTIFIFETYAPLVARNGEVQGLVETLTAQPLQAGVCGRESLSASSTFAVTTFVIHHPELHLFGRNLRPIGHVGQVIGPVLTKLFAKDSSAPNDSPRFERCHYWCIMHIVVNCKSRMCCHADVPSTIDVDSPA